VGPLNSKLPRRKLALFVSNDRQEGVGAQGEAAQLGGRSYLNRILCGKAKAGPPLHDSAGMALVDAAAVCWRAASAGRGFDEDAARFALPAPAYWTGTALWAWVDFIANARIGTVEAQPGTHATACPGVAALIFLCAYPASLVTWAGARVEGRPMRSRRYVDKSTFIWLS